MGKKFEEVENKQESSKLERVCFSIIQYGTYIALFTPLIMSKNFFFPFVCPKTIFFRILVDVIFSAYIILALFNRKYRPKVNSLFIVIALFLLVLILTSVIGVNFERSFWSTFERMTGLLTFFHLFGFFIVLTSVFKKREDWEKILGVSIVVGIILSFYVLFFDTASTRGGGTIGNTSFMAAYLLFDIFFAFILLLSKKYFARIFAVSSLFVMIPVLLASTCRAGIAAFFGGIFLLMLGYFVFSGNRKLKFAAVAIILILIVSCGILFIIQPNCLLEKAQIFETQMKPRLVVWEIGFHGWLERPLLGWGPENFNIVFNKYFHPCLFLSEYGGETWFDRAHNIIFDTLVSSGLIGLLSYLSIFGASIFLLLRKILRIEDKKEIFVFLIMAVLLIVYFVQNLFVFDMISTYMMLFLCLAYISFLTNKDETKDSAPSAPKADVNPFLGAVGLVLMLFVLWFGSIGPMKSANNTVQMAISQNIEDATKFFEKAISYPMEKYEPREHFCKKVSQLSADRSQDKMALLNAFNIAEREMKTSCEKNFLDFRPHLFLGKLYNSFFYFTGDVSKLGLAEQNLNKAIELSPANQQGYWYLAETKLAQEKNQEARELLQTAIDLEPSVFDSHWYLMNAYMVEGDYEKAMEKIKELEKAGYDWKSDFSKLKQGIKVYEAMSYDQELIDLYKRALKFQGSNFNFINGLFESYKNTGDMEGANRIIEILENIPNKTPEIQKMFDKMKGDNGS
jgi:O-antigen ligase